MPDETKPDEAELTRLQVKEHIERYHPEMQGLKIDVSPDNNIAVVRSPDPPETLTDKTSAEYQGFMSEAEDRLTNAFDDVRADKLRQVANEFETFVKERLIFISTRPDPEAAFTHQTYREIEAIRDRRVRSIIGDDEVKSLMTRLRQKAGKRRGRHS